MSNGIILLKCLTSPLSLLLGVRNVKTTCPWMSCPGNLFQILNLTFDPCFKAKWGQHTKMSRYIPFIGSTASEYKNSLRKSWSANVLPASIITFCITWGYLNKKTLYLPLHCSMGFHLWKQLKGGHGPRLFSNCWLWPLTPSSMSSGVILLQRPCISLSSPLLLILRWDI